jgi:hypothetical protein
MDTKAEVPATNNKPSIWTRIKTAAKKTAAFIAKPFKAIGRTTKSLAKRMAAALTKVAKKVVPALRWTPKYAQYMMYRAKYAAKPVTNFFGKLWQWSLKPICQVVLGVVAVTLLFVGAAIAPVTTILVLAGTAVLTLLLARALQALEAAEGHSKAARFTLRGLEIIARIGRAVLYTAAGALVVVACMASAATALYVATFIVLSYLQVRGASSFAFYVWCVATGSWGTLLLFALLDSTLYLMRSRSAQTRRAAQEQEQEKYEESLRTKYEESLRAAQVRYAAQEQAAQAEHEAFMRETKPMWDRAAPKQASVQKDITPANAPGQPHLWTRGNFLCAKGTEELWGTSHDVDPASYVDVDDGDEVHSAGDCQACGESMAGSWQSDTFCIKCVGAKLEDEALIRTGVSLKARNVRVPLTQAGMEAQPAYVASKNPATPLQWLVTVKFRTRDNVEHPREWSLLDAGDVVGTVVYDNDTRRFTTNALGETLKAVDGSDRSEVAAKRLVYDIVSDARNALDNMLSKDEKDEGVLAKVFEGAFVGKKA